MAYHPSLLVGGEGRKARGPLAPCADLDWVPQYHPFPLEFDTSGADQCHPDVGAKLTQPHDTYCRSWMWRHSRSSPLLPGYRNQVQGHRRGAPCCCAKEAGCGEKVGAVGVGWSGLCVSGTAETLLPPSSLSAPPLALWCLTIHMLPREVLPRIPKIVIIPLIYTSAK